MNPDPAIGSMRDRVQLLRRQQDADDSGGHATLHLPLATVWGRVRVLTASPGTYGAARAATVTHSLVVRFRTDLKPGDRAIWRGRTLEIVDASDLNGRRAFLSCTCVETETTG
ncbi:MAG TPA: phage head closure protein [Devosiaceae bacterium]